MLLPTTKVLPKQKDPGLLTIFGPPKIGKTSKLVELENNLIIDTEKGTKYVSGLIVSANSLPDLQQIGKAIMESEHKYDYITIDTIDKMVEWVENAVVYRYNQENQKKVSDVGDIPYGAGYGAVRTEVMTWIGKFRRLTPRLILVGHRKKTIIGESKIEFSASTLDLTGKLKNLVCSDSDAIGYVYRDEDSKLMITFKPSEEVEAGSRPEHLRGKTIEFDWSKIYVDKAE